MQQLLLNTDSIVQMESHINTRCTEFRYIPSYFEMVRKKWWKKKESVRVEEHYITYWDSKIEVDKIEEELKNFKDNRGEVFINQEDKEVYFNPYLEITIQLTSSSRTRCCISFENVEELSKYLNGVKERYPEKFELIKSDKE